MLFYPNLNELLIKAQIVIVACQYVMQKTAALLINCSTPSTY